MKDELAKSHIDLDNESVLEQTSKYVTRFSSTKVESTTQVTDEEMELIINIGTGFTKAGFGGDDAPRALFPSIIGRPKHPGIMVGMDQKDAYVGDEAQSKRGVMTLKYPIENGVIKNFDDFEKLIHHTLYNELRAPEGHGVVLATQPTTIHQLSKIICMFFETFHVPQLQIVSEQQCVAYANGRINAIVIDFGLTSVRVAIVINGAILDGSLIQINVGGRDVTDYQMKLMTERGYSFTTTAERDIVRDIKEKLGYAVSDIKDALGNFKTTNEKTYEMPDGQCVTLGSESFRINEVFFAPSIIGKDCLSLQNAVAVAISRVSPSLRSNLLANIIFSGGPACTPNLKSRLVAELNKVLPINLRSSIKVRVAPEAKYASWIGASILSDLSVSTSNYQRYLTQADYDAYGPDQCAIWANSLLWSQPPNEQKGSETEEEKKQEQKEEKIIETTPVLPVLPSTKEIKNLPAPESIKQNETKEKDTKTNKDMAEETKEEQKSNIAATKSLANTNTLLIRSSHLISKSISYIQSMDSLPTRCLSCPGYFTSQSTFHCHTNDETKWNCSFCGTEQVNVLKPDVPKDAVNTKPTEIDFIPTESMQNGETKLSDSVEMKTAAGRLVIFCIDTSGSMGATTEMNSTNGIELYTEYKVKKHFKHVSRLQFVKAAVRSKILTLARTSPNAIPIIVTFGSTVKVNLPDGTTAVVEGNKTLDCTNLLLAKGADIVRRFTNVTCGNGSTSGMRSSCKTLLRQLHAVEVSGCTALGPALATAIGMCSNASGSQIIVCTDGVANIGVGKLDSKGKDTSGFYNNIALAAKAGGTSISILTLEGCEAGLESLGTTADMTSGRVTVVDSHELKSSFASLASTIVGTKVKLTVLSGNGVTICKNNKCFNTINIGNAVSDGSQQSFNLDLHTLDMSNCIVVDTIGNNDDDGDDGNDDAPESFRCPVSLMIMLDPVIMSDGFSYERIEAEDWLSRGNTTSPLTNKTLTSTQLIPNVTLRQSIEEFHNTKAKKKNEKKNENENKNEDQNDNDDMEMQTTSIPIQIQLDYEDSGSVKHIRMFTLLREVSFSRKQAENGIDARIVAISTIHSAAELAQTGEYDAARIVLLSTQRLLQRSMKISNQKDYMAFIVLAEKLDNWMRESQLKKKLLNVEDSNRDDDAVSLPHARTHLQNDHLLVY